MQTLMIDTPEATPMQIEAKVVRVFPFKHSERTTDDYEAISLQTFANLLVEGWDKYHVIPLTDGGEIMCLTRRVPAKIFIDAPVIANRADAETNKIIARYNFLRDEYPTNPVDTDDWHDLARTTGTQFDMMVDKMIAFAQAHK